MAYMSLEDIIGFLKPSTNRGNDKNPSPAATKKENIQDVMMRCCLDHRAFLNYEKIKKEIEGHVTSPSGAPPDIERYYHGLTSDAKGVIKFSKQKDDYFKNVESIKDIVPDLKSKPGFRCMTMSISDPFVSPAIKGAPYVDFFLNYTPPIVAAQMLPYLDVEFQMIRPKLAGLSNPSVMRFLLGSVGHDALGKNDKSLAEMTSTVADKENVYANSGMELFLMPQTLTNMDNIGDLGVRFTRPKPFVPFASIESLDINIANAGALTYAHKRATLRLKVHDKSRIGEISEFIKGPVGFRQALVWTTYGWISPLNRGDENEYFKFVNDNMMVRDCWSVINAQFGIDASGQVSVTLDMVSHAAKVLRALDVSLGASGTAMRDQLDKLRRAVEEITRIKEEKSEDTRFSVDILPGQVLNAVSTNGTLLDIKKKADVETAIKNTIAAAKNGGTSEADLKILEKSLKDVADVDRANINTLIRNAVRKKFKQLALGPDPFLAGEDNDKFFDDKQLKAEIDSFDKEFNKRNKAVEEKSNDKSEGKPSPLSFNTKVVSFGKLFMNFIIPAAAEAASRGEFKELQIYFYNLNDKCGPVSGRSVAEFPIDVHALAYAYDEKIKSRRTDALTVDAFFHLIVENQFSDKRSIGYGMNAYYMPYDRSKPSPPVERDDKKAPSLIQAWIEKYGVFVPPQLEIYIEASNDTNAPGTVIKNLKSGAFTKTSSEDVIIKIHIYDKTHTPHTFAQQVFSSGDQYSLGDVDKGVIARAVAAISKKYAQDQAAIDKLRADLESAQNDDDRASILNKAAGDDQAVGGLIATTKQGKNQIRVKKDRKSLKSYLKSIVPNVTIGTNGTMVLSVNLASKIDSLQGTLNLMDSMKGTAAGKATMIGNGLEEVGGLPLRSVPAQLTMTTMGVPIASLYQQYFVDFDTGTTLDNLYTCNVLAHSITPGKFITNWTFMYGNGYAKFSPGAPTQLAYASKQIVDALKGVAEKKPKKSK